MRSNLGFALPLVALGAMVACTAALAQDDSSIGTGDSHSLSSMHDEGINSSQAQSVGLADGTNTPETGRPNSVSSDNPSRTSSSAGGLGVDPTTTTTKTTELPKGNSGGLDHDFLATLIQALVGPLLGQEPTSHGAGTIGSSHNSSDLATDSLKGLQNNGTGTGEAPQLPGEHPNAVQSSEPSRRDWPAFQSSKRRSAGHVCGRDSLVAGGQGAGALVPNLFTEGPKSGSFAVRQQAGPRVQGDLASPLHGGKRRRDARAASAITAAFARDLAAAFGSELTKGGRPLAHEKADPPVMSAQPSISNVISSISGGRSVAHEKADPPIVSAHPSVSDVISSINGGRPVRRGEPTPSIGRRKAEQQLLRELFRGQGFRGQWVGP